MFGRQCSSGLGMRREGLWSCKEKRPTARPWLGRGSTVRGTVTVYRAELIFLVFYHHNQIALALETQNDPLFEESGRRMAVQGKTPPRLGRG